MTIFAVVTLQGLKGAARPETARVPPGTPACRFRVILTIEEKRPLTLVLEAGDRGSIYR